MQIIFLCWHPLVYHVVWWYDLSWDAIPGMHTQPCILHLQAKNRCHVAWAIMCTLVARHGTCNVSEQAKMQLPNAASAVQERGSVFARRHFGMCA